MKEATGELNATVVVVIIVAMLVAFFYFTIWPAIRNSIYADTKCNDAICPAANRSADGLSVECYVAGDSSHTFTCAWKG